MRATITHRYGEQGCMVVCILACMQGHGAAARMASHRLTVRVSHKHTHTNTHTRTHAHEQHTQAQRLRARVTSKVANSVATRPTPSSFIVSAKHTAPASCRAKHLVMYKRSTHTYAHTHPYTSPPSIFQPSVVPRLLSFDHLLSTFCPG